MHISFQNNVNYLIAWKMYFLGKTLDILKTISPTIVRKWFPHLID